MLLAAGAGTPAASTARVARPAGVSLWGARPQRTPPTFASTRTQVQGLGFGLVMIIATLTPTLDMTPVRDLNLQYGMNGQSGGPSVPVAQWQDPPVAVVGAILDRQHPLQARLPTTIPLVLRVSEDGVYFLCFFVVADAPGWPGIDGLAVIAYLDVRHGWAVASTYETYAAAQYPHPPDYRPRVLLSVETATPGR